MTTITHAMTGPKAKRNLRMICIPFLAIAIPSFLILELKEPAKASALAFVLALAYGVSISMIFILFGVKIAGEKDEFQKKMLLEALLWGMVATLVVSTIWGSLEVFTDVHHMPGIFNFGVFLIAFSVAKITIFSRNAIGDE